MKNYLNILFLICSLQLFAQKKFIKGYFIDNAGKKTECLINETAWESNKDVLEYKLNDKSEVQKSSLEEVAEYGSDYELTVKRFDVDIDVSLNRLKNISNYRSLNYERRKVFLTELVDGVAKLYVYQNSNQLKFFYSYKTDSPIQLEYKEYQSEGDILSNQNYKQQLLNALSEEKVTLEDVSDLEYNKNSLFDFFLKVNGLTKEVVKKKGHTNKSKFNLYVKAGAQSSSFTANSNIDFTGSFDFKNKTDIKYGVELEVVMSYCSSKWAFYVEAYTTRYEDDLMKSYGKVHFSYETVEVPMGTRFYFFLNNKSKIFLEGALQFSFMTKNEFKLENFQDNYSDFNNNNLNFHFGVGYNFNNKYSITLGTMTKRNLMSSYGGWDSNFKNYSLTVGYNLF